jgi:hypothetical protein
MDKDPYSPSGLWICSLNCHMQLRENKIVIYSFYPIIISLGQKSRFWLPDIRNRDHANRAGSYVRMWSCLYMFVIVLKKFMFISDFGRLCSTLKNFLI